MLGDLAREEELERANPLRHYMAQDQDALLPPQNLLSSETTRRAFRDQLGIKTVEINLMTDPSPGCGGVAWAAGEILASYLACRGPEYLVGRSILELGSGTGIVGLVAGALGARSVCITDQAPLLPMMRRNVMLNGLESTMAVEELNWGDPLPECIPRRTDLILAADCVYFEPAFELLVKTLTDLVVDRTTEVLFCYKKRRKADKRFFALLKKHFTWTDVADDPNRETYVRDGVSLLRLSRRVAFH